jgi:predicted metal-dependent peptidase
MQEAKNIISKAKWGALNKYPFFAYLLDACVIKLDEKIQTAGVDAGKNMYINPKWITSLNHEQVVGVLAHEVMHKALEHFLRMPIEKFSAMAGTHSLANIAQDIVINNMLLNNGMSLPSIGILPSNNEVEACGVKVENINKKSSEEIYYELLNNMKQQEQTSGGKKSGGKKQKSKDGKSSGNESVSFDEHIYSKDEKEKSESGESKESSEKDWGKLLNEAAVYARHCGTLPAGMDEIMNAINKPQIKWKSYLRKVVAANIPRDYSWKRPNKKYIWQECYMPSSQGDSISVVVSFDTSASVSKEELDQYISEVVSISKSYSSIDFRILTHDVAVHDDIQVKDSNKKILKALAVHGRGGTSHIPLYEYIKEKRYNKVKLLISFTDGYSDYPEKPSIPTIFVLSGNHLAKDRMPSWALKVLTLE